MRLNHELWFSYPADAARFAHEWAEFKSSGMDRYKPAAELSDNLGIWNSRIGCWQNYQFKFTADKKLSGEMLNGKKIDAVITSQSYVECDFNYKDRSRHGQPHVLRLYADPMSKEPLVIAFPTCEKM